MLREQTFLIRQRPQNLWVVFTEHVYPPGDRKNSPHILWPLPGRNVCSQSVGDSHLPAVFLDIYLTHASSPRLQRHH